MLHIQCLLSLPPEGVQDSIVRECAPGLFIPRLRTSILNVIRCIKHGKVLRASELMQFTMQAQAAYNKQLNVYTRAVASFAIANAAYNKVKLKSVLPPLQPSWWFSIPLTRLFNRHSIGIPSHAQKQVQRLPPLVQCISPKLGPYELVAFHA